MILIGGWVGGNVAPGEEGAVADAMTAALERGTVPHRIARAGDQRGLIIADQVAEEASRVAGISGRPHWTDQDLAGVAVRDGAAAALLAGHARYGAGVVDRIKGPFAFALIDRDKGTVLAAIDRAGIASLSAGRAGDGTVVFASSADGAAAYPAFEARVRPQAVYEYLFHYNVPAPLTIYRGLEKLLPAQILEGEGDRLAVRDYWRMPYTSARGTSARGGDFEEWADRFRHQIRTSFTRTIEGADESDLGAFLSGGLDSSTVTGLLVEKVERARSFTIGFEEARYDERAFARMAVDAFGTDQHEYIPTPADVLDLMPKIAEVYDEPYGNTSAVPAYLCARMARDAGVRVMLAGDGGDEIFAGNERYAYMKRIERYGLIPAPVRRYLMEPLLAPAFVDNLPILGKARRLARRYAVPMPDRLFSHGYMLGADARALFRPDWLAGIDADASLAGLRAVYERNPEADILQRMMALDLKTALADNDLRKVNRMCALAGVEVRYPMLEDDLMAFAASIPSDLLMPGDKLRDFFKRAMRGFLPDGIIDKEKHGFGLPFEHWIKTDKGLQDAVRDLLADAKKRPIFNTDFLETVARFTTSTEPTPLDGMAWDLAMLELWLSRRTFQL